MHSFRPYDCERDRKALQRLWTEIGWIEVDNDGHATALDRFLGAARSLVAEVNGEAECLVACCDGSIQHLDDEISMGAVLAVTTSYIARKRGLASSLTAQSVARDAMAGLATSALGMFEQGFYSRLGFGTGPYELKAQIDPAQITLPPPQREPVRISSADSHAAHRVMMNRLAAHGSVRIHPAAVLQAEMDWTEAPLGLGFRDDSGNLTHFIWGSCKGEHGPYEINTMAYGTLDQLLELLGLIRSLGDQVLMAQLQEPAPVQLQDFLRQPFRNQNLSAGGKYAEMVRAEAYWQLRINDLETCLASTHLRGADPLAFNLSLHDPIANQLPDDFPWRGISGDYTIELGSQSCARKGHSRGLAHMDASVGGFSRLWLGGASATAIAATGELKTSSQKLVSGLERTLCLPRPRVGWEF